MTVDIMAVNIMTVDIMTVDIMTVDGAVCIPRSKFDRRTFSPTNHLADMK